MEFTRGSDFTPHPIGVFRAVFVEWGEDNSGQYGTQAKLSFDTEEQMDDGRPFRISTWSKPSLHEKAKIYKMLKAFGENPDELDLEGFTLDDYIGRKLQVVIEHYKGQDGSDKAKIANFLPMPKKKANGSGNGAAAPAQESKPAATRPNWEEED